MWEGATRLFRGQHWQQHPNVSLFLHLSLTSDRNRDTLCQHWVYDSNSNRELKIKTGECITASAMSILRWVIMIINIDKTTVPTARFTPTPDLPLFITNDFILVYYSLCEPDAIIRAFLDAVYWNIFQNAALLPGINRRSLLQLSAENWGVLNCQQQVNISFFQRSRFSMMVLCK